MAFPRPGELKHIPFTDEEERSLINYLDTEIQRTDDDRQGLTDRLDEEINMYEAKPEVETKQSPWDQSNRWPLMTVCPLPRNTW